MTQKTHSHYIGESCHNLTVSAQIANIIFCITCFTSMAISLKQHRKALRFYRSFSVTNMIIINLWLKFNDFFFFIYMFVFTKTTVVVSIRVYFIIYLKVFENNITKYIAFFLISCSFATTTVSIYFDKL